jgi:hypothetical protein
MQIYDCFIHAKTGCGWLDYELMEYSEDRIQKLVRCFVNNWQKPGYTSGWCTGFSLALRALVCSSGFSRAFQTA